MTPAPTQPSAQAPAVGTTGALTPEIFRFLTALLAYAKALEARVSALEGK